MREIRTRIIPETTDACRLYVIESFDDLTDTWVHEHTTASFEVAKARALNLQTTITAIPGTDRATQIRVYHSPGLNALLDRLTTDHHVENPPCHCDHDCCGHVCARSFHILALTTLTDLSVIAVVASTAIRNY